MPAIPLSANSKILITGGQRPLVRTELKIAHMKQYPEQQGERFEMAVLEDMKPGAFDEAVKGVNGYTSYPFFCFYHHLKTSSDRPLGRNNAQLAAKCHSPWSRTDIKRVIYTSSSVAIISDSVRQELNENDWNEEALVTVQT
ncbi:hypothetical protein BDQ17DRAFT_1432479 [Cyathus striatus]|nr:hypothetical protein BDQ17DRAFT_1432479 [Cyathus striatus]